MTPCIGHYFSANKLAYRPSAAKGLCFATSGINVNSFSWKSHNLVGIVRYALGLHISRENMLGFTDI